MNATGKRAWLKVSIGSVIIVLLSFGSLFYRTARQAKVPAKSASTAKPGTLTETAIPTLAPVTRTGLDQGPTVKTKKGGAASRGSTPPDNPPAPSLPASRTAVTESTPAPPVDRTTPSRPKMQPDPSIPFVPSEDARAITPPRTETITTRQPPSASTRQPPSASPELESAPDTASSVQRRSGKLVWSGTLTQDSVIIIEGNHPSSGTLSGELPGVPVLIDLNAKSFGVAEAPSPSNGWKRIAFRGRKSGAAVVTITWTALP